jgi:hypothetical protein
VGKFRKELQFNLSVSRKSQWEMAYSSETLAESQHIAWHYIPHDETLSIPREIKS